MELEQLRHSPYLYIDTNGVTPYVENAFYNLLFSQCHVTKKFIFRLNFKKSGNSSYSWSNIQSKSSI